jgi:hypothetical protein
MKIILALILWAAGAVTGAQKREPLALTPPMGWNAG